MVYVIEKLEHLRDDIMKVTEQDEEAQVKNRVAN